MKYAMDGQALAKADGRKSHRLPGRLVFERMLQVAQANPRLTMQAALGQAARELLEDIVDESGNALEAVIDRREREEVDPEAPDVTGRTIVEELSVSLTFTADGEPVAALHVAAGSLPGVKRAS